MAATILQPALFGEICSTIIHFTRKTSLSQKRGGEGGSHRYIVLLSRYNGMLRRTLGFKRGGSRINAALQDAIAAARRQ